MERMGQSLSLLIFFLCIVGHNGIAGSYGTISCFVCSSRNGSNGACEDPFNAGGTPYVERCRVPRRGYEGEFPAHFCIKIIGTSYTTNEKIVIRRCTTETWHNQCGRFSYEDDLIRGCILTCDLDGCNSSVVSKVSLPLLFCCASLSVLFLGLPSLFHKIIGSTCVSFMAQPFQTLSSSSKLESFQNKNSRKVLSK